MADKLLTPVLKDCGTSNNQTCKSKLYIQASERLAKYTNVPSLAEDKAKMLVFPEDNSKDRNNDTFCCSVH
ncbi:TPA: hypothetical protein N0F65_011518 [Lagenidium giganteum]|uniref:Guanine nucleotide-binding protein subunit gamma n=1 Tax=Lagenidium giganteum TaxID=4803 RepID=A0AAV2Z798_9STRA|nr:TPA: hypothetical protein N0F65_011518 [Lagenidium giganteum]